MLSRLFKKIYFHQELAVFKQLKKQGSFTETQKEIYQNTKLKRTLFTAQTIPFYKSHLLPLDINNITYEDFISLPLLNKSDIRENFGDLKNRTYKNLRSVYENTSGGSTGEPVRFMQTREQLHRGAGNYHYGNFLNGINPEDSMLIFWGALRDMNTTSTKSFIPNVKNYLLNSEMLNTFVLNSERIRTYIERIESYQPHAIKAYVHSFYQISKYINDNNIQIKSKPIIHTSTGPLYPEIRSEIKKAFNNTHVFSFYGSREVSAVATEVLGEEGMEVLYDNVFLEVLDGEGKPVQNGEEGEIVITTLNNHYMPLIRYRIGDRAIKNDASSSFGTLKLKSVLGRTLGVIHKRDGSTIDGQFFTSLFFGLKGINNFQLIQKAENELELNVIKNNLYESDELEKVLKRIKEEVGDVQIHVNFCDNINLTSTGKIMYVYSEMEKLPHIKKL